MTRQPHDETLSDPSHFCFQQFSDVTACDVTGDAINEFSPQKRNSFELLMRAEGRVDHMSFLCPAARFLLKGQ